MFTSRFHDCGHNTDPDRGAWNECPAIAPIERRVEQIRLVAGRRIDELLDVLSDLVEALQQALVRIILWEIAVWRRGGRWPIVAPVVGGSSRMIPNGSLVEAIVVIAQWSAPAGC